MDFLCYLHPSTLICKPRSVPKCGRWMWRITGDRVDFNILLDRPVILSGYSGGMSVHPCMTHSIYREWGGVLCWKFGLVWGNELLISVKRSQAFYLAWQETTSTQSDQFDFYSLCFCWPLILFILMRVCFGHDLQHDRHWVQLIGSILFQSQNNQEDVFMIYSLSKPHLKNAWNASC